jgi:lysophospholipase L1-like esterase
MKTISGALAESAQSDDPDTQSLEYRVQTAVQALHRLADDLRAMGNTEGAWVVLGVSDGIWGFVPVFLDEYPEEYREVRWKVEEAVWDV